MIVQQPVGQLVQQPVALITQIPWGHNIAIISKCKNTVEALYYAQSTAKYNWSRSVLVHQIESGLYAREGKALNNFAVTLPKPQSDLAVQTLKDPYIFDFLSITGEYREKELENALVSHVTQFLLELGAGFSYIGRQMPLQVDDREFFINAGASLGDLWMEGHFEFGDPLKNSGVPETGTKIGILYGYPPDKQQKAADTVMKQAEVLADYWVNTDSRI